jgi:hypothetical protein
MNIVVPLGPNSAAVQVLDQSGADITGSCSISAVSSDPTQVQIGSPDPSTPNVIPFTSLVEGGTADINYSASNSAGQVQQTDTISIQAAAPTSMKIVYGTTIPSKQHAKK